MAKKRLKHRSLNVSDGTMISLCETCVHMPQGSVPQNNFQKDGGHPEQPHMYCSKKAFFPDINYDNDGVPFYDVAKCDGYDRYNPPGKNNKPAQKPRITRANET